MSQKCTTGKLSGDLNPLLLLLITKGNNNNIEIDAGMVTLRQPLGL